MRVGQPWRPATEGRVMAKMCVAGIMCHAEMNGSISNAAATID